ncbi:MAG: helix-turn-helix domain-containing protein [bacterium]
MINSITSIISIITISLLFIFTISLFTFKKEKFPARYILALFLFSNGIYILNFYIPVLVDYNIDYAGFYFIGKSTGFLFGPLLYYYARKINNKSYLISGGKLFHLIPFTIYFLFIFISYTIQGFVVKNLILSGQLVTFGNIRNICNWLMQVHIIGYLAYTIIILRQYDSEIKEHFSSMEKMNYSWLIVIFIGFIAMWAADIVHLISLRVNFINSFTSDLLTILSLSTNLVMAVFLFIKSFQVEQVTVDLEIKKKYQKSRLTETDKNSLSTQLEEVMNSQKPYLIPNITITELSEKANIPARSLSQVINENYKMNFFDFVNSFRINEAKGMLKNPSLKDRTVLEILYESGFNSKTAFNRAFVKTTGITPTEFRKTNGREE